MILKEEREREIMQIYSYFEALCNNAIQLTKKDIVVNNKHQLHLKSNEILIYFILNIIDMNEDGKKIYVFLLIL